MERTLTGESSKSQETEAPLSDGAYDFLMNLNKEGGEMESASIYQEITGAKKEEPSEEQVVEEATVYTTYGNGNVLQLPESANTLIEGFQPPALVRSYSSERWNSVPQNPSRNEFTGSYNFRVLFEDTPKISKSMAWTYSKKLSVLFCKIQVAVPIQFHLQDAVPHGTYVRMLLICRDDTTAVVKTCPLHIDELKQKSTYYSNPYHMLRCISRSQALYGICNQTGKYSLRFPILPMQAGVSYQVETFSFQCYSSCFRREIDVICTLEHNGEVFGRQSFGVRVCACPGRDRLSLERKRKKLSMAERATSSDSDGNRKKRLTVPDSKPEKPEKRWVIAVSTHKRYKVLKNLYKSLEIYDGGEGACLCGEASFTRTADGWSFAVKDRKKSDQEEE